MNDASIRTTGRSGLSLGNGRSTSPCRKKRALGMKVGGIGIGTTGALGGMCPRNLEGLPRLLLDVCMCSFAPVTALAMSL